MKEVLNRLGTAAAAMLVAVGIGLWAHAEWWRAVAVVGLATSFGRWVLYFHPWFLFIQAAVNVALIVGLLSLDWPSRSMVGLENKWISFTRFLCSPGAEPCGTADRGWRPTCAHDQLRSEGRRCG